MGYRTEKKLESTNDSVFQGAVGHDIANYRPRVAQCDPLRGGVIAQVLSKAKLAVVTYRRMNGRCQWPLALGLRLDRH